MNSKQTIIKSASDLIKLRGYFGAGIDEIRSEGRFSKGSLYHHFPGGKDEIIKAALEASADEYSEVFRKAMKGKGSAENGLKAVVDVYIAEFRKNGLKYGCPLASVAIDVSTGNEVLRRVCAAQFSYWINSAAAYLEYKNVKSEFREKAEKFVLMLEGSLILARVMKSDRPLRLMKKEIRKMLS